MNSYSISSKEAMTFLDSILKNWNRIQIDGSMLFGSYSDSNTRCDLYDNSLLVNLLIMINSEVPHPFVINILDFAYGSYEYFMNEGLSSSLIAAAFMSRDGKFDVCGDSSCQAQDVGNNSMLCIAICKFITAYPGHIKNEKYTKVLVYLLKSINKLSCTVTGFKNNITGYKGRVNDTYISSEHMIDLYALTSIVKSLPIYSENKKMIDSMNINSQNFIQNMYYDDNKYYIGTNPNCSGINTETSQPVDTATWNMLSGVDNNKERKKKSLEFVYENFIVPFSKNTVGGIKFTLASDCAQYENTGAFLCSLTEFKRVFKKDISFFDSKNVQDMYNFIHGEISNNRPINGGYGGNTGCFTYIGPPVQGWQYFEKPHLAANVYSITALLALGNNKINIYQNLQGPNPPNPPNPNPNPVKLSVLKLFIIIIVSIFFLISLIFGGYHLYIWLQI
jgi:hypothetical protein